jgi:hypothetical protein
MSGAIAFFNFTGLVANLVSLRRLAHYIFHAISAATALFLLNFKLLARRWKK